MYAFDPSMYLNGQGFSYRSKKDHLDVLCGKNVLNITKVILNLIISSYINIVYPDNFAVI